MSSREGLFKLLQLKTRKCGSIASLFPLLRILIIQINVAMIRHWTVSAELCHARSVVVRRAAVVRYLLQLGFLRDAHTGLMKGVQSIDVENFLCCELRDHKKRSLGLL